MKIKKIQGLNFRNYFSLNLDIEKDINVFFGKNAQGKTNILESIFYGALGLSYRTSQEENLITFNNNQMMVYIEFTNNQDNHNVRIKKYFDNQRMVKEINLDGKKISLKDYYGFLNVVIFSPEDLQFVKGEPALRRRFLDMQISQTNKKYLETLTQYNKVLKQRNSLLKQIREKETPENVLDTWDEKYIQLATEIYLLRQPAIKKLQEIANKIYQNISSGETLQINYILKDIREKIIDNVENYSQFLAEKISAYRNIDIIRGVTSIGPHHDDLLLAVNEKLLKDFGSQGQQRTVALALKLSQLEYIRQEINEYPILLLDDVMSELDESRRNQLLQFIDKKVQTFITVNDRELIPDLQDTAYYRIENGTINKI